MFANPRIRQPLQPRPTPTPDTHTLRKSALTPLLRY
jgi:hypothetical protein